MSDTTSDPTPSPMATGRFSYHPLTVAELRRETADACSLVLDVPPALASMFAYQAGQYLTLRVVVDGEVLERCYSLSSAPAVDSKIKVTAKEVAGGRMSHWLNHRLQPGDTVEVMPPAGRFCLRDEAVDLLFFCAGSGITPCLSIVKTVLHQRVGKVRMLYANRDRQSIIFAAELATLEARYPERFELIHSLDSEKGFVTGEEVARTAAGFDRADCYICGPGPFMTIVETALEALEPRPGPIFIERFSAEDEPAASEPPASDDFGLTAPPFITVVREGQSEQVPYFPGHTIVESAWQSGVLLPVSCRLGSCGACIAKVTEGTVIMDQNNVLTDAEVAEGYALMCQSFPTADQITIEYDE